MSSSLIVSRTLAATEPSPACELLRTIADTADEVRRALRSALADEGLTFEGYAILRSLAGASEPVTPSMLAQELGTSRPLLSRAITRLQLSGLVASHRDPLDRRTMRVSATTSGQRAAAAAARSCARRVQRLTSHVPASELPAVLHACAALSEAAKSAH